MVHMEVALQLTDNASLRGMEGHDSNMEGRTFLLYHKTVVAVNAPSARVTEGVPINNTLSLTTAIWRDAHFFFITRQLSQ